jgi:cytochrome P450
MTNAAGGPPSRAARPLSAVAVGPAAPAATSTFLADIAAAEARTPVPPPPTPPDPSDPKYVAYPSLLEADTKGAADAAAAFARAAKIRGGAVAHVIATWLAGRPLVMLQELLDQPRTSMPIFAPPIGPAIVMRHDHVITCLERTDLFTVDPYAGEMARATDDKAKKPDALSHFMLGTDRDDLYRLDDVLLRKAMSRRDERILVTLCRHEAGRQASLARSAGAGEIDVVETLAKCVPMRLVADYIGVPAVAAGEASPLPGLKGGDVFPLDDELQRVYTFTRIQEGMVPTAADLFTWVKDAFRNTFNNFNPASPLFSDFRERGIVATERLSAYVHALIVEQKDRLRRGEAVPDTMLTRLLRMQLEAAAGPGSSLQESCEALLGGPIPDGVLNRALCDSMIRSNIFGTTVGAVVNPQEATCRIADAMVRLKDGEYVPLNGSTYEEAVRMAGVEDTDPALERSLDGLRRYALEALRLRPQGEVLLRACVADNTVFGVPLRKGTPVFVGYAAAMRDPEAIPDPLAFDVTRDERAAGYLQNAERAHEAPQSLLYLQHGYGRHKCLGRYASEITMRESLRALLRLGALERRSELEFDDQQLYATRLRIGFRS